MDYFDFGEKITDKNLKISAIIECENNKALMYGPDIVDLVYLGVDSITLRLIQ